MRRPVPETVEAIASHHYVATSMTSSISAQNAARYVFGPFILEVSERRLQHEGEKVALPRKAFDLLLILVERAGHLQTRELLIQQLWPNTIVDEHSLTWNLHVLRRAIGDLGDAPEYIETVRGIGYRFIARVSSEAEVVGCPWDLAEEPALNGGVPANRVEAATRSEDQSDKVDRPGREDSFDISSGQGIAATLALTQHKKAWIGFVIVVALGAAAFAWRASSVRSGTESTDTMPRPSIAVLPLENRDSDPVYAYFASGLQDAIVSKLSTMHGLRVFSRESVARVMEKSATPQDIARELGASNLLLGSIQHSGDDIVVGVRLVAGENSETVWERRYTRRINETLDVQSDVAERVAIALRAKVLPGELDKVERLPTRDAKAYDLFLRAEYEARGIEFGDSTAPVAATQRARGLYEEAINRDPNFALALSRLSYLDSRAYWFDVEPLPSRAASGQRAAERALAIDPDLSSAHIAMGYAHYYGHRNYDAAVQEFERALQMLPENSDIMASIAYIDRRRGHWDSALKGLERAAALDPRNPLLVIQIADTLMATRRYEEAKTWCARARMLDQGSVESILCTSFALLMEGDSRAAGEALRDIRADQDLEGLRIPLQFVSALSALDVDAALRVLSDAPVIIEAVWTPTFIPTDLLRGQALDLKNDEEGARHAYSNALSLLTESLRVQSDNPARLSLLGLTLAGLGQKDAALAAGERAAQLRPMNADAMDGPFIQAALAEIYIRVGKPEAAIPLIRQLLDSPAGLVVSARLIDNDPRFARIRKTVLSPPDP